MDFKDPRGVFGPNPMMRTYLLLQLCSEGAPLSEIAETLEDLGLRPHGEGYDFIYDWGRPATVRESLEFADRLQEALRGKKVYFRVESSED